MTTDCIAPAPSVRGYTVLRCRCTGCTRAHTQYQVRRNRLIAYGQWSPNADAAPVREHLERLSAAGIGSRQVATLAGVGMTTIRSLRGSETNGQRHVRTETARAILAVQPSPAAVADGNLVDPTGTRRRMQALAAIGWSIRRQAQQVGRNDKNYHAILTNGSVTAGLARSIARLYERLSATPAPEGLSRRQTIARARRNGWPPPLAWEDIDIDDPSTAPNVGADTDDIVDEVAIREVIAGRVKFTDLREQEKLALFRDHLGGWTYNRIMDLLHVSGATVQKWRTKVMYGDRMAA